MNKLIPSFIAVAFLLATPGVKAAVNIAHVQNATTGFFVDSNASPAALGGVSVGFFAASPLDAAFGGSINGWSDLLTAGFTDVRTIPGAVMAAGFDWDYPIPIGGSEINIPITELPAGTQLYVVAFNAGTFANGFAGASEWAVVKDPTYLSPADLGTKALLLSVASGASILQGSDIAASTNILMVAIPEPSRAILAILGFAVCGLRRRR